MKEKKNRGYGSSSSSVIVSLSTKVFSICSSALCILWSGVMEWSLGLEPWSGVLQGILGVEL